MAPVRALRWLTRLLLTGALCLAAAAFWLYYAGLPRWMLRQVVTELAQRGLHLEAEALHWDPLNGLTLSQARYYLKTNPAAPVLTAQRMIVTTRLWRSRRARYGVARIQIQQGRLRWPTFLADPQAEALLDEIAATISVRPRGFDIEALEARLGALILSGGGQIVWGTKTPRLAPAQPTDPHRAALYQHLLAALALLRRVRFLGPTEARLAFFLNPADLAASSALVTAQGQDLWYGPARLDAWQCEAEWNAQGLHLSRLRAERRAELVTATGALQWEGLRLQGEIHSTWRLPDIWDWVQALNGPGPQRAATDWPTGPATLHVTLGPAPWQQALDTATLEARLGPAEWRNVWFDECHLQGALATNRFLVQVAVTQIGRAEHAGPLRGVGALDFTTSTWDAQLETGFSPTVLQPLLDPEDQAAITDWVFHDAPPQTQLRLNGDWRRPADTTLTGAVTGANLAFRGVEALTATAQVAWARNTLTFTPLQVQRPEGALTANMTLDFNAHSVYIAGHSTVHPPAIAQITRGALHRVLEPFTFHGASTVTMTGRVDYGDCQDFDFLVDVETYDLELLDWRFDQAHVQVQGLGEVVYLPDIAIQADGGHIQANAQVDPSIAPRQTPYRAAVLWTNLHFATLLPGPTERAQPHPDRGRAAGHLRLTGVAGDNQGHTVNGQGQIEINDGAILRFDLFGPLTRLLSRLGFNLGELTQDYLRADFTIADGAVHTRNARLQGRYFTLEASGQCAFDERLDFDLQLQLLRDGLVARLVNFVTFPMTRLFLRFHISGSLSEPRWRPVNLPKEIYLQFD